MCCESAKGSRRTGSSAADQDPGLTPSADERKGPEEMSLANLDGVVSKVQLLQERCFRCRFRGLWSPYSYERHARRAVDLSNYFERSVKLGRKKSKNLSELLLGKPNPLIWANRTSGKTQNSRRCQEPMAHCASSMYGVSSASYHVHPGRAPLLRCRLYGTTSPPGSKNSLPLLPRLPSTVLYVCTVPVLELVQVLHHIFSVCKVKRQERGSETEGHIRRSYGLRIRVPAHF